MKQPRWWFYLPVAVVAVGGIVFGPRVAEMATLHEAAAGSPPAAASKAPEAQQPFDYFPDHYVNQAKEASQPIDQF
jgi:hypothetical protein